MTRLSIIIPVHNAAAELPKCLESLLSQVGPEDQILLIEDASTDGSDALCDRYAEQNPCITAYHVCFRGPSATRNYGLQHATGQYILFVDADDWMDDHVIAPMLSAAADYELVVAGYYFETETDVCEKKLAGMPHIPKENVLSLYKKELLKVLWNKVFRGDIIRREEILFDPSYKKGEDLLFVLQYLRHVTTPIGIVDQCVYHYISKQTGVNRSHRETMDNKRNRTEQIMELLMEITSGDPRCVHHIRDYMAVENDLNLLRKVAWIKKEARHPIVRQLLHRTSCGTVRLLRLLHALRLDVVMFLLNRVFCSRG